MKLSLRKTLVATATATALVFSGTTVASAADNEVKPTEDSSSEAFLSSSSDDEDDEDKVTPKMIKEYIQIVVSIIRAMDSAMALFPQARN